MNKCKFIRSEVGAGNYVDVFIEGRESPFTLGQKFRSVKYCGDDLLFEFKDFSILVAEDKIRYIRSDR